MTKDKNGHNADRDAHGRYINGSGNLKGRPKRTTTMVEPDVYRDMIFDVADHQVTLNLNGKVVKASLYQANVLTLGTKGAHGDAGAAKAFTALVDSAVEREIAELRAARSRLRSDYYELQSKDPSLVALAQSLRDEAHERVLKGRRRVRTDLKKRPPRRDL